MFLGYSLKRKDYRCFNQRTKTIVESANVKVDENFGVKERMLDYNFDEKKANANPIIENIETFFETKNDFHNDIQIVEQRDEPREEVRIESMTPTLNRNLTMNHPTNQII